MLRNGFVSVQSVQTLSMLLSVRMNANKGVKLTELTVTDYDYCLSTVLMTMAIYVALYECTVRCIGGAVQYATLFSDVFINVFNLCK